MQTVEFRPIQGCAFVVGCKPRALPGAVTFGAVGTDFEPRFAGIENVLRTFGTGGFICHETKSVSYRSGCTRSQNCKVSIRMETAHGPHSGADILRGLASGRSAA